MQTECSADRFGFVAVAGRAVVAGFDGGTMTSDAGAMLLGATDRAIGLIARFAGCFKDQRAADLIEHTVPTLVGQRVFGVALGYEDLIDHDALRHDQVEKPELKAAVEESLQSGAASLVIYEGIEQD